MKFVYALVSSEKDFYVEEALLSMYTMKKHNPDAEIVLAADSDTIVSLRGNRERIKVYIDEIVTINPPYNFSLIQKSRFIKTSLRENIEGTFLYIDNDTIITGKLDELENLTCDVGAVYNRHKSNWDEFKFHPIMNEYKKITGVNPAEKYRFTDYYNGGVIFSLDTREAHKFFNTWHNLWLKSSVEYGFHKDQPDMWYANYLNGNIITPIDGSYNFQAIYPQYAFKSLSNCKIFHYFSSSPIGKYIRFRDLEFMHYLRENGIDRYVDICLDNLVDEYIDCLKILSDEDLELYFSPMAVFGRKISKRFPSSNKLIKWMLGNKVK